MRKISQSDWNLDVCQNSMQMFITPESHFPDPYFQYCKIQSRLKAVCLSIESHFWEVKAIVQGLEMY